MSTLPPKATLNAFIRDPALQAQQKGSLFDHLVGAGKQ